MPMHVNLTSNPCQDVTFNSLASDHDPRHPTLTLPDGLGRELNFLFPPNTSGGLRGGKRLWIMHLNLS